MKPSLTFNYFREYNSYQKGQIFLIFFLGGVGGGVGSSDYSSHFVSLCYINKVMHKIPFMTGYGER